MVNSHLLLQHPHFFTLLPLSFVLLLLHRAEMQGDSSPWVCSSSSQEGSDPLSALIS